MAKKQALVTYGSKFAKYTITTGNGMIEFTNFKFKTDDPEAMKIIESDPHYQKYTWLCEEPGVPDGQSGQVPGTGEQNTKT